MEKNKKNLDIQLPIFQEKVDKLVQTLGGYWPPLSMLAAITEEVGEIARELNSIEKIKKKKKNDKENHLKEEIGDTLFALSCLANYYNINLIDALNESMEKFYKRDKDRFTPPK